MSDFIYALVCIGILLLLTTTIVVAVFSIRTIRARNFLSSSRVIIQWTYSPDEWLTIQEEQWQDSKEDWKVALGCLTTIFSFVGLGVGFLVGFEDDLMTGIVDGVIGLAIGLIVGLVLGSFAAAVNYFTAKRAHQRTSLPIVALGETEIYYDGGYFKSNGTTRYIQRITLNEEDPSMLVIELWNPVFRGPSEQTWEIVVPKRMNTQVKDLLKHMRIGEF